MFLSPRQPVLPPYIAFDAEAMALCLVVGPFCPNRSSFLETRAFELRTIYVGNVLCPDS
jgi:hypothetical protein